MSDADDADGGSTVDRVDGEAVKRTRPCPYCGTSMVHRHCEYVCPQHGVVFDCSDPFYG
ncbi:HVO_2523 family zinc finger protein [Halobaculum marinum]|uniref:HVO_2523 family zinc finger protein n=1 Tax=Halobaculum marinum TaxID=3031996 RepID=A0ABD5WXK3_9EURY|nr:HVO_2523 family zinc finger protein [Halobaculum sp. DT55]